MKKVRRTRRPSGARSLFGPARALFLGLLAGGLGCATAHPPAVEPDRSADAKQAIASGETKLRQGDLDGALGDYNRAISLRPRHAPAFAGRAFVYYQKGDLDRSVADFTRAVELDPRLSSAFGARAFVWLTRGELDRAIADFTRTLELDPNDAMASHGRGLARSRK